ADEYAVGVYRQRGRTGAEVSPNPVFAQILLHVRNIKRGDCCASLLQIAAHSAKRFRAPEVAHHRHNQIPLLEILDESENFFAREITPILPRPVGCSHQFGVCRKLAAAANSDAAAAQAAAAVQFVLYIWAGFKPGTVDKIDALEIASGKFEAVLVRQLS